MTEKKKTEEEKVVKIPQGNKPEQTAAKEGTPTGQPPQMTVQSIIEAYPNDREKIRDHLLLSLVTEMTKISGILDWFAKRKQEDIDKNIVLKP